MIKKIGIVLMSFWLVYAPEVKADEGMWLPMFIKRLNYADMQKAGLKLTPEEIYSVNNSSIKDAIVGLGSPARNFCSGEIVSSEGLFITNHHCGYGTIQENSTTEHDYLKDGFWAMKRSEEIYAGFNVSILHHMEDVTAPIQAVLNDDMSAKERSAAAKPIIDSISKANSEEGRFSAVVKSFFAGNEYYMFVYEVFPDVRLVGAPPSSVGKFGGDTDNWMWPRHTGDFCMFRIYADKDGKPAKYSKDNVPYKPKHHLPVNIKGVKEGDYAMIFGFPGSTNRYMSSYGIEHKVNKEYPNRIEARRAKLDSYEEGMMKDQAVRIQYSSKHAGVSNYWKNFIGMSKALKALNVADLKRSEEAEFEKWANETAERKAKYGNVLKLYEEAYGELLSTQAKRDFFLEGFAYNGIELVTLAWNYSGMVKVLSDENPDPKKVDGVIQQLKGVNAKHFKDYNEDVDKSVFAKMIKMYVENVPADQQPEALTSMVSKAKGDYNKLADMIYGKSMFANADKLASFLDKPSAKMITKDPAYILADAVWTDYIKNVSPIRGAAGEKIQKAERLYIDAIRQMNPKKSYAPDANSTLRMTYGNVLPYKARDAVHYDYFTTAQGIVEKYQPGNHEFDVPEKLITMIKNKDYGRYGKDGELRVCFLSNNDITGGNSGSGVINAEGHLIGTAFDGNWEAMSGDIAFEKNLQRTISVDIRYTLFIIDKFAGAGHLVEEMTVIE